MYSNRMACSTNSFLSGKRYKAVLWICLVKIWKSINEEYGRPLVSRLAWTFLKKASPHCLTKAVMHRIQGVWRVPYGNWERDPHRARIGVLERRVSWKNESCYSPVCKTPSAVDKEQAVTNGLEHPGHHFFSQFVVTFIITVQVNPGISIGCNRHVRQWKVPTVLGRRGIH